MNILDDFGFPASDDLDAAINSKAPIDSKRAAKALAAEQARIGFIEKCPKCRGTGRFYGHSRHGMQCFACKGKGSNTYKQSAEKRAQTRISAAARKERKLAEAIEAFKAAYPAVWKWMDGSTFEFAVSMREALAKYGSLTDKQLAACQNCVARLAEAIAKRAAADALRSSAAPEVSADKLLASFSAATANGLRYPKLHFGELTISPAGANSKNPGALYVKSGEQYLGKIVSGRFLCTRECGTEAQAKVVAAINDPAGAARQSGLQTGRCSCCNRELTDQVSVANGIGPICAGNFGW